MALDNRDQIMKDIDTLSLEKYIDELSSAVMEGLGRCKTEKDIWGAVEVADFLVLFGVYLLVIADHFCATPPFPKLLYPCPGVQSCRCNKPPTAGISSEPYPGTERKGGFCSRRETAARSSALLRISSGRNYQGCS